MHKHFLQFLRPSEDQLKRFWRDAIITFDASVLLNLYGLSEGASASLMDIINNRRTQVWLPHQFGLEFSRNRPKVIARQVKNFLDAEKDFEAIESKRLKPRREHPYLSSDAQKALSLIREELSRNRKRMEKRIASDEFMEFVMDAFSESVGSGPNLEERQSLHKIAETRFSSGKPPGNQDLKAKGIPEAYGDFIAWHQIIEEAKSSKKDFLLVIDDVKDDWWWKEGSRLVGPLPDLLEEFRNESGQQIWFYTSDGFLRAAKEFTDASIDEAAIEEVKAYLDGERQAEAIDKERKQESDPRPTKAIPVVAQDKKAAKSRGEGE